jgi:hypothetical protein
MRQLKIAFLFLFTCSLNAVESQLNMSFQRRFGPDSFMYNEPLYFAQKPQKKKTVQSTGRYREQIRKKLKKTNRKRPSLSAKTIE